MKLSLPRSTEKGGKEERRRSALQKRSGEGFLRRVEDLRGRPLRSNGDDGLLEL